MHNEYEKAFAIGPEVTVSSKLNQQARLITVKVISANTWGSGILICNQDEQYIVLTAAHILSDSSTYQIETHDGEIYNAYSLPLEDFYKRVSTSEEAYKLDIAFLTFSSASEDLQVASIGNLPEPDSTIPVYSAGFSFEVGKADSLGFLVTRGQIESVTSQPLQNGYQIGYTNRVERGMSGGPLINSKGLVIGMNGMDKYPLWGNPYIFQDGSLPLDSEMDEMRRLSWAIPTELASEKSIELLGTYGKSLLCRAFERRHSSLIKH